MANNTRARRKVRISRALGIALTPKAEKYLERRPYAPGQHGRARRKQDSDYAVRLREKQRLRAQYNIREAQMARIFEEARRTAGLTGENLIELLEMRLDALVLRAGFARTSAQARQLIVAMKNELNANGLGTRIWAYDHNFDSAWSYVPATLDDATGNAATDGVAFHDYAGNPSVMTEVRNAYPNKNIMMTERSVWGTAGADRMAQYFRNWAAGYNGWVTMLDSRIQPEKWTGTPGPTLVIQNASSYDNYWLLPEVSLIGQYSKYVKAGAKRISSSYGSASTVTNVSFLNPDNTVVSVVINQTASSQKFKLSAEGWELLATLPAKTVGTYVWTRESAPGATNLLANPGFETDGTLSSWNSEWHNAALAHQVDTDYPYTGNYKLTHYSAAAYQQLSGQTKSVANGTYRASVWARSSGGQRALRLYAKGHGGAELTAEIGTGAVTGYTQYVINNIPVTTGTLEVGVYSDANAQNWAAFDQFELVKQ